jgi:hypothetical protein
MTHVMLRQVLVAGPLMVAAVVLFAAGFWIVGGAVGLLAIVPVGALLDSVVIWIRIRSPRHWHDPPLGRSFCLQTDPAAAAPGPLSMPGAQMIVRRGVQWWWFAPAFMIGWPTWFHARWGELRDLVR